jgi:hypothetical protein
MRPSRTGSGAQALAGTTPLGLLKDEAACSSSFNVTCRQLSGLAPAYCGPAVSRHPSSTVERPPTAAA